jgi:hypothetical protein
VDKAALEGVFVNYGPFKACIHFAGLKVRVACKMIRRPCTHK